MTPAEIEDRLLRFEAQIAVGRFVVLDLLCRLSPAERVTMNAGLSEFATALRTARDGPADAVPEALATHMLNEVNVYLELSGKSFLAPGGMTVNFGSPPFSET